MSFVSVVERKFAELRARRFAGRAVPPVEVKADTSSHLPKGVSPPPVPDVARLVSVELARRDRERADREAAAWMATFTGGPCWACGSTFSWVRRDVAGEPSEDVPGWQAAGPGRTVCHVCHLDRHFGGGVLLSDRDWRGGVALDLLRAAGSAGFWVAPAVGARLAASRTALFWAEHSPRPATHTSDGAVPDRFGFVDVSTIVGVLAAPKPEYHSGIACPGCGESAMWRHDPGQVDDVRGPDGVWTTYTSPPRTWCAGCRFELPVSAADRRRPERAVVPAWLGRLDPRDPGPAR